MRFPNLDQTKSWRDLQALAVEPSLLTEDLTKERINKSKISSPLLSFFYAYSHLKNSHLEAFDMLIEEIFLFDRVKDMLAGKKINLSENRAVCHHRYRNPEDKCAQQEIEALLDFCTKIRAEGNYDTVLQIGIGGSELGPKAIYEAAKYTNNHQIKAYFLSNLDPLVLVDICKKINPKKTLFVLVSKSGTSLETKENFKALQTILASELTEQQFLAQTIVVTAQSSPLKKLNVKAMFAFSESIGGRFSILSPVGLIVLALCFGSLFIKELLSGAYEMDCLSFEQKLRHNPALMASCDALWNASVLSLSHLAVIPYSSILFEFSMHLQQLICESLGKATNQYKEPIAYKTGALLTSYPGTNAQHSFFQLLHQGTTIIPTQFICIQDHYDDILRHQELLNINAASQMMALALGGPKDQDWKGFEGVRPSTCVILPSISPASLGSLISFYENMVMFQGFMLNINAYDQPGVELGKYLAQSVISQKKPSEILLKTIEAFSVKKVESQHT